MEEDSGDWSPFWLQNTTDLRRIDRFRHRASSMFFSSGLLILLLLVTAVFFLVFVVPSTVSFTAQIVRPSSVKKSWDSINIVLVLFALLFGFLSRNKNEDTNISNSSFGDDYHHLPRNDVLKRSNPSTPHQWYGYSPREGRKSNPSTPHEWHGYSEYSGSNSNLGGGSGLRRTFSSYPDLRGWSTELAYNDDPWRFYDDTVVETYRRSDSGKLFHRLSWREAEQPSLDSSQQPEIKNVVHVDDTVVNLPKEVSPDPPPPSSPTPQPQTPTPQAEPEKEPEPEPPVELPQIQQKPKRTSQSRGHRRERRTKKRDNELEENKPIEEPSTPPPPPPPPLPPPPLHYVEQKSSKSDKKRGGGSATKEFLNSLYHKKKKKKKQRAKSTENMDSLLHQSEPPATHYQLPPPSPAPPPPPLPPPPFFQNLFTSKKDKRKRTEKIIVTAPVPTALPTRPPMRAARATQSTYQTTPVTPKRPSRPVKIRSFESVDDNHNSGGESPMMRIPPPPPPPPPLPFYKPAWKFAVQGDYVRVDSVSSSEPSDMESDATPTAAAGGSGAQLFPPSPLFCPSPDVNTKAERFISRFRAGLKLEKMNSFKKQQEVGFSNLGPHRS